MIDPKLNPVAVRERARSVPGCREIYASGESVVSFLVGLHQRKADCLVRVNVFCDTGTVGSSRVLNGKVRQTFRRNVTTLDMIERLLKIPQDLAKVDESLVGLDEEESRTTSPQCLKKELELADVGLCILQSEREKLVHHLEALQMSGNPIATGGNDEESESSSVAGLEFRFRLPVDVTEQVEQCLRDITKMDKQVKAVSTNGKGTVFLYGNGGVAYTPNIPRALYQKLRQLRNSTFSARPSYISLGTRDRYFVVFNDGSVDWKGPKQLNKILAQCIQTKKIPKSVAFGSSYDSFFVVFHDGSWQYQGRSIPDSLEKKLSERDDRADLETVNLGPSGEWFLKAVNGRMWWSGISPKLDQVIANILNSGNYLHSLDFGENESYFVSYDE